MTDTVLVKPRHGLILDGIPSKGAEIPRALAEEWIADRMVVAVQPLAELAKPKPVVRRSPKGSGATRPIKRRRSK